MLDLNFVRDNLPLVEEKLRQRGLDPGQVLKDFLDVDAPASPRHYRSRNQKARRNRASEEIAKLKKSGQDATAQIAETKELARADPATGESRRRSRSHVCRTFWPAFPTCPTKACR